MIHFNTFVSSLSSCSGMVGEMQAGSRKQLFLILFSYFRPEFLTKITPEKGFSYVVIS